MTEVLDPPQAPSRTSPRRARTRERLMSAAVEVFAERGILGASVEEVCEAAGFTRGAFYSNFADKDALVLALVEQSVATQYAAAERAIGEFTRVGPGTDVAAQISHVLREFEAAGTSDRTSALVQQEMRLYAARVPALAGPYLTFAATCRAELSTLIEDAVHVSGLEFTLPLGTALELLMATHEHIRLTALFTGEQDTALMHALVMTLTRQRV